LDKLILHSVGWRGVLPAILGLALCGTILLQPLPAAAAETSGSKDRPASSEPVTEDFTWISRVHDDIQSLSMEDSIPRSRILEQANRMWHGRIASQRTDSLRAPDALIEKLFGVQIDHITSLLNGPPPHQDTARTGMDRRLDEAAHAINQLSNLAPLVLAARDSIRSSLLVVSSVGCRCELERCASMARLFASMHSDTLITPIAMIDLMQVPPLEDLLGKIDIPYWVLFSENGYPATIIEGASDAEDVRYSVVSWLGTRRILEE
jgi:hypothetical protein